MEIKTFRSQNEILNLHFGMEDLNQPLCAYFLSLYTVLAKCGEFIWSYYYSMAIQLILPAQPPVNMHILFYLKPKCWCRAIFGRGGLDWWPPTTCGKHLTIQISFLPYLWLIKNCPLHELSTQAKPQFRLVNRHTFAVKKILDYLRCV